MIVTLFNFLWIFISAFLMGIFVSSILPGQTEEGSVRQDPDLILMLGIMGLTVYAEFFSLFYRLGFLATLVLLGGEVLIAICFRKRIGDFLFGIFKIRTNKLLLLLVCVGVVFFAFAAAQTPDFYDSSLYHGQAIQWIEKYGVVKGLGNLHNRFAYNSAFLCLQALFSWRSVVGQSLHGMNAFLGLMMSVYALSTFSFMRHERIRMADFMNLLILFYISVSLDTIASPNTDFLAMLIVLYVISKWMREYEEKRAEDIRGVLCVIAVFGATVKLSIALLGLLILGPLYDYIRNREWKKIYRYGAAVILVVFPFMMRNIMISGYLLYPYAALDLLEVDWKMPAYTVVFDNHEIVAWGRGLNDVEKYNYPFRVWFPEWFAELGKRNKALLVLNGALVLVSFVYAAVAVIRKEVSQKADYLLLMFVSVACLAAWIFSAPLIRYGYVYLYLLPAMWLGRLSARAGRKGLHYCLSALPAGAAIAGYVLFAVKLEGVSACLPNDYPEYACYGTEFQDDEQVYLPMEGDRTGYQYFPAIPYPDRLGLIELREDSLEDGYRMKQEYRDADVTTYGQVEGQIN